VIDLTPMSAVVVADGVATIGAGARLGDVYDSLSGHGLTMAAGCGPEVGIAGLTLGGGLGILGRRHGLTSDQLVGAEVVLADGRIVECDEGQNEDLFWALRGAGGGQFGVVTSLRHRTLPAPEQATSFHLVWPVRLAAAVIGAWQAWAPAAPDELAASLLVTAGPDPGRPPLVNVFGAMLGGAAATAGLLEELVARVGAGPESQSSREAAYRDVKRHLAEHGPGEAEPDGHPYSKSEFFRRPLPDEAVDALVDRFCRGRVAGVSRELDFTPWGGAYNRVPSDATAFAHRDELFLLKHGIVVAPGASSSAREAGRAWLRRSWELVHPCGSGGVYPNFPDPELEGWERAYHGDNHERLARVKRRYDPESFFSFPQSLIGPLAGDLGETPV
jgi:FAD/FMN-containing dehydrogenase